MSVVFMKEPKASQLLLFVFLPAATKKALHYPKRKLEQDLFVHFINILISMIEFEYKNNFTIPINSNSSLVFWNHLLELIGKIFQKNFFQSWKEIDPKYYIDIQSHYFPKLRGRLLRSINKCNLKNFMVLISDWNFSDLFL